MESDAAFLTDGVSTVDNPVFPAGELGYQAENIDIVTYAGRVADPRGAWAARRTDVKAPWIFWYRLGPREQVRGCLLDATSLITQARGELADRALARIDLVAEKDLGVRRASSIKSLASALPGYALQCDYGDLFVEKLGGARLALSAVALLLGLFVLGAAFLVVYSRRELRDAELKATFVTQVSHELRTPLTSIRMFADMLGAPDLALEKRAKFAGNISRESQRLSGLIERLLTFHTLERDQHAPEITRVEVVGVVRETMEEMDGTVRAAGMKTELDLPNEPVNALAEPSAIKQALLNLMENAIKYGRDGGVIRILLKHDATNVRLRVADQGPGIAPPLRARVFEPFVQGGQMLTDKAPGLGLGLSIARGGLRQVGGDLVLLSSEKGACFEIQLPSAPVS